jgi:RNA polymerase sigma factor for flagellar operon FliA
MFEGHLGKCGPSEPDEPPTSIVKANHVAEAYISSALVELGLMARNNRSFPQIMAPLAMKVDEWVPKRTTAAYFRERNPYALESGIDISMSQAIKWLRRRILEKRIPLLELDPPLAASEFIGRMTKMRLVRALLPAVALTDIHEDIIARAKEEHRFSSALVWSNSLNLKDERLRKFAMRVMAMGMAGFLPHPPHRGHAQKLFNQLQSKGHHDIIYRDGERYYPNPRLLEQFGETKTMDASDARLNEFDLDLPILGMKTSISTQTRDTLESPEPREQINICDFEDILIYTFARAYIIGILSSIKIPPSKYSAPLLQALILSSTNELVLTKEYLAGLFRGKSNSAIYMGLREPLKLLSKAGLIELTATEEGVNCVRLLAQNIPGLSTDQRREIIGEALDMAGRRLGCKFDREDAIRCLEAQKGMDLMDILEAPLPLIYESFIAKTQESVEIEEDLSVEELQFKYTEAILEGENLYEEVIKNATIRVLHLFLSRPPNDQIKPRELYLAAKTPEENIRRDHKEIGKRARLAVTILMAKFPGAFGKNGVTKGIKYSTNSEGIDALLLDDPEEFILALVRELVAAKGEEFSPESVKAIQLPGSFKILGRPIFVAPVLAREQARQEEKYVEEHKPAISYDGMTREEAIAIYSPKVTFIARRIASRLPSGASIQLDDLINEGFLGFLDALNKFDHTKAKFGTYVEWRIKGAILDALRAQDPMSRTRREEKTKLEKTKQRLAQQLKRAPIHQEVADEIGLTMPQYYKLLADCEEPHLKVVHRSDSTEDVLLDTIPDHKAIPSDVDLGAQEYQAALRNCIKYLPPRLREIVNLYYYHDLKLKEIGEIFGVSDSRISQLLTEARWYLNIYLEDSVGEA